jgi:hypothetical protein
MITRRPVPGRNRRAVTGAGGGGGAPFHPVDIGGWTEFWDASSAANTLTLSGSDVISWEGSTGTHDWTDNGNSAQRPDAASTINGVRVVNFDGAAEWLLCSTIDRDSPGTTPTYYWGVFLIDAASNFDTLVGGLGGASRITVGCANTSGDLSQYNTTQANTNTATTIGTQFRLYVGFTNTTGDFVQVDDTAVTGSGSGNVDADAGLWFGSRGGAASTFFAGKCACFGVRDAALTAGEEADLKAWAIATLGTA